MTQKEFNKIVDKEINTIKQILTKKGKEYALDNSDRLKAFKMAAKIEDVNTAESLCGMMAKHIVSIFDMSHNPDEYKLSKWQEKITDTMNYLLLLLAIVENKEYE